MLTIIILIETNNIIKHNNRFVKLPYHQKLINLPQPNEYIYKIAHNDDRMKILKLEVLSSIPLLFLPHPINGILRIVRAGIMNVILR
jgi:hypothetical protein